MRCLLAVLLALVAYGEARPRFDYMAAPSVIDSFIIGGVDAAVGEFPWQLSQQRLGTTWSHSCGASLLTSTKALSAAHCIDGASVSSIRVIAGLHDRTAIEDGVLSNIFSYKVHELYGSGPGTFPNDIAILTLTTAISEDVNNNIQFASLPDAGLDNLDGFVGRTCVMSGWGRTSASSTLPVILQKASIQLISTDQCNEYLSPVSGASATDSQVCLYDTGEEIGSCNGDSGGPLNCNYPTAGDTRRVVFGVTSWGISSGGNCLQSYPSVYTRTSAYLDWIAGNL
jgi:secreted trypsin-like serine protease